MNDWTLPGYTEVRELGRGASGRVVLAVHDATGEQVAVKYLTDAADPEAARRFRAEARLLAEIDDPHVARLLEYVETDSGAAIVMELVDGVALRALLREHGPTEPEAALVVLKGSLLGLAAAHATGIVHRDYKPENVLVDRSGHSKLTDFGIAVRTGLEGILAGTPRYMAPEQWRQGEATVHTDIYAATATFYECLVGAPPFQADDLATLERQHAEAPVPTDQVPEPLRDLVRRGMAKRPEDRPADATQLLAELEDAALAYGQDWEERGRSQLARRLALLALLLPTAGAVAGGSAVGRTLLGPGGWLRRVLVGAGATVVLAGAGGVVVSCWPDGPAPVAQPLPTPTPTVAVTATPDPTPTPTSSATPSPTPTPTPTPSPTGGQQANIPPPPPTTTKPPPPPPPPPPPVEVTRVDILRMTWVDNCRLLPCPKVNVLVLVDTTKSDAVTLNVDITGAAGVRTYSVTLSGATRYTVDIPTSGQQSYLQIEACGSPGDLITATAYTSPAAPSTDSASLRCP